MLRQLSKIKTWPQAATTALLGFMMLMAIAPALAETPAAKTATNDDVISEALVSGLMAKLLGSDALGMMLDHLKASLDATAKDQPLPEMDAKTAEKMQQFGNTLKKEGAAIGVVAIDSLREQILREVKTGVLTP